MVGFCLYLLLLKGRLLAFVCFKQGAICALTWNGFHTLTKGKPPNTTVRQALVQHLKVFRRYLGMGCMKTFIQLQQKTEATILMTQISMVQDASHVS